MSDPDRTRPRPGHQIIYVEADRFEEAWRYFCNASNHLAKASAFISQHPTLLPEDFVIHLDSAVTDLMEMRTAIMDATQGTAWATSFGDKK